VAPREFTIAALFYGDHPDLARRCLGSILANVPPFVVATIRLGLNAISPATRVVLDELQAQYQANWTFIEYEAAAAGPVPTTKYPTMRRILYDPVQPIQTPYLVWFDDDSYIETTGHQVASLWHEELRAGTVDLLGSKYTMALRGGQVPWIRAQPWYGGREVYPFMKVSFRTGGWWIARVAALHRFDYPWSGLNHNGGDVMLGELCRQQGLRMATISPLLKSIMRINADPFGRESAATRRGYSERPIGLDYQPEPGDADDVWPGEPGGVRGGGGTASRTHASGGP